VRVLLIGGTLRGNLGRDGGGFFNAAGADAVLRGRVIISFNTAVNGAGLYNRGTLSVAGSIVARNRASVRGGGAFNARRALLLVPKTTIRANTAPIGPNIFNLGVIAP
jgi:hypothetical protein